MKKYFLPIGKRQEEVLLPEEHVIYDIHGNQSTVCADLKAAALEAIRNPIGTKPLRELVHAGETVAIVISDITRLCGTSEFLPVIEYTFVSPTSLLSQPVRTAAIRTRRISLSAARIW